MSWDLYAQHFPNVETVAEIPEDFHPSPLGERDAIITKITTQLPDADFGDPSWGTLQRDDWSIEISLGKEPVCRGFALHVRGGGAEAVTVAAEILDATGARAVDMQTGEFFTRGTADASFERWQAYRDQVISPAKPQKPAKRGLFSRLFG